MSDSETIARPYSRAAYEQAGLTDTVDRWMMFLDVAGQMAGDPAVVAKMSAPDFLEVFCQWIEQYLQKTTHGGLDKQEHNFMKLLDAHDRLGILPAIAKSFRKLHYQEKGICSAMVYTAHPLKADQQSAIRSMLERKTGKNVILTVEETPALIAGVKIEYDGLVIDQSARGRLEQFARKLDESRN